MLSPQVNIDQEKLNLLDKLKYDDNKYLDFLGRS
jgi:hypothetical protein